VIISSASSPILLTTEADGGEINATQSFLAFAILSITYCCTVVDAFPVTTREMSVSSAFPNKSQAVSMFASVGVASAPF